MTRRRPPAGLSCWFDGDPAGRPPYELAPVFSGGRTISKLLPDRWRPLRDRLREDAGHRCEVCGYTPDPAAKRTLFTALHGHEAWRYDLPARRQWLERFWVLCWRCHSTAHGKPVQAWWPEAPPPAADDWTAYRAAIRQAGAACTVDALHRWAVFTIDLDDPRRRGWLPPSLIRAFARKDAETLPGRIRNLMAFWFDELLAVTFEGATFTRHSSTPLTGAEVARVLTERERVMADPVVRAAMAGLEQPSWWAVAHDAARKTGRP